MEARYLLINGALKHNVFLNQGLFGPVKHKNNTVLGKINLFTPTFQTSRMLQIPLEIPSYLHKTCQPPIPFPPKNLVLSNVSLDQKKNYGKHKRYSEEEIRVSIQQAGFDNSLIQYAYAMFMSRSEFGGLKHKNKDIENYDTLRKEITKSFFSGNTSFTIHDALASAIIPKR